jgi:hypothetical protein
VGTKIPASKEKGAYKHLKRQNELKLTDVIVSTSADDSLLRRSSKNGFTEEK